MKAIRIHEFGNADVLKLEDIPVPTPAADEVLIKVYATSVNPIDWKMRNGGYKGKFTVHLPLTPGWDVSGVIEQAGEDVKNLRKGDEVYSRPDPTRDGTYAEYVVVKAAQVALKPKSIPHDQAAAVPLAGLTAWQGLFQHGQLQPGQKVLIHGGSGGVGTFAIQFAKWKGAYVIATASGKNLDFVKSLGADKAIDYKDEKFEDIIKHIDLVFDTQGGDTQKRSLEVLKPGGRLITTLMPQYKAEAEAKSIHMEGYMAQSDPKDLEQIAKLVDDGKIKPYISHTFMLAEAKDAQEMGEHGHAKGKIVIKVV